ncbi:MAG: NTPase KAP [Gammaproteobacteria bacterium]|nr:MAG: NTPase KAP [Gammaproteobacteria bacterium]RLA52213.1 MAG: NTPase KAP [Gammaproteobacteria bacterium]
MANPDFKMPSALDRQIVSPDQDAFGHRHFASALRSIIESEEHKPPYSVGLLGGWGTGKSSIKNLYTRDLDNDEQRNSAGLSRSERFHCITFNAWRFGGMEQDVKRALIRHVFQELGGSEDYIRDRLFRQINETADQKLSWREYTGEVFRAWGLPLIPLTIILAVFFWLTYLALGFIELDEKWIQVASSLFLTSLLPFLVKNISFGAVSTTRPINKISLPSTSAEEYEDLLLQQLSEFNENKFTGKKCERLVVFIDDLDRLSAEEMVLGLDAIRTFMEIPEEKLPNGIGMVFVISCDESRIADALARRHRQEDMPGAVFTQSDARRYLDRIFQFRLEIPPFPRQDMRQYAISRMNSLPQIVDYLDTADVPVETVVDRMIHVGVQNPRNALQIVNAFAQSWWIANKRETEELGSKLPGGLHEGAVTAHPISLGALCALKVSFPEFYMHLQEDPSLVHRMTDVMVRGRKVCEQPVATQELLAEKYYCRGPDTEDASFQILPRHRALRQYLASLNGIRWPPSLESLLFLSEDPITREYGAKSRDIYNSMVSGDTFGVLEGLGRHADSSMLSVEQVRLLHNMTEGLRFETKPRQINSSRVIADLAKRTPDTMRGLLIGQLCRTLNDEQDLRFQLGVSRIGDILTKALPEDQRAIASRMVDDTLAIDEDIQFLLETQESPSLEEAVEITRQVVSQVLPVRGSVGLEDNSDRRLLDWLLTRIVKIGERQSQLPHQELEGWLEKHEKHLLPSLGNEYANVLSAELHSEVSPAFDVEHSLARAQKVFEDLGSRGESSRELLWPILTSFVSLQYPNAAELSWKMANRYMSSSDANEISAFTLAFVGRLERELEDDNWELDNDSANATLISILSEYFHNFDKSVRDEVATLCINWSVEDVNEEASITLLQIMEGDDDGSSEVVYLDWTDRLLSGLPKSCIEIISARLSSLPENARVNVGTQLASIVSSPDFDEETKESYWCLLGAFPSECQNDPIVIKHLSEVWPQIAKFHANQNDYLNKVFPAVAKILHHTPKNVLGNSLHTLFTNAKNQVAHYSFLHSQMNRRWPRSDADLSPYDPDQIFTEALAFVTGHPGDSRRGILQSMASMVENDIVAKERSVDVASAACAVWAFSPEEAIGTFKDGYAKLSETHIANLLDGFDWETAENSEYLSDVFKSVVQSTDIDTRIGATKAILDKGLSGTETAPDHALDLWVKNQGQDLELVLESSISSDIMHDSHKVRLWQQVLKNEATLTPEFLIHLIPTVLLLPDGETTSQAILGDTSKITDILKSTDLQASLVRSLMLSFSMYPSKTIKSNIVRVARELCGESALAHVDAEKLNETDVEILRSQYKDSRELKKLMKSLE